MFKAQLAENAERVQRHLMQACDGLEVTDVTRAMRYALDGGKRLRAHLVMESARIFGIEDALSLWPAAAIEAVHAYSLVHDDLPAMDDDDLRRGQPTVHVKWDEATAILAGDGLQALGFELVTAEENGLPAPIRAHLALGLARASGARGMVIGQAKDIAAESATVPLTLEQIIDLQRGKTGALIEWSATAGAVMAQQDTQPLARYAQAIGLAFQIADDILDVEGDADLAGKRLGKDQDAGKATFVSLLGLDEAKRKAAELIEQSHDAIKCYGDKASVLRATADFIIARDR